MYFLQDDFFIFTTAQTANLRGVLSFLIPRSDTTNFRPVCLPGYYFLFYRLFGLNPLPYHVVQVLFQAVAGVLVYLLTARLLKKISIALLAALLFVISWTHFYDMSWIVCTCNQISLTFILLYLLTGIAQRKCLPYAFLLLALLSVEAAVAAPALLFLLQLFFTKKSLKENFYSLLPHFLIIIFYVVYRFFLFKIPAGGTYRIELIPAKMMKNVIVFILWLFNFPEAMTTHFTISLYPFVFADNVFAETFPKFSIFISLNMLLFLTILAGIFRLNRKSLFNKHALFCVTWFFVGLSPILIIPHRTYPYYTFIAQIGFWMFFAKIIVDNFKYWLVKIFLACFVIANLWAVKFTNENHWIFTESAQVKSYFKTFQELKIKPKWKYLFWQIDDPQARQALSFGQGLNVFLNNYDIKFYLQKQDIPPQIKKQVINFDVALSDQLIKKSAPSTTP